MTLPQASRRVVVLRHECGNDSHFDLMVEDPASRVEAELRTWRILVPPVDWRLMTRLPMQALNLHRRDYLEYEGPLSDKRGVVTRVDEGMAIALQWSAAGGTLLMQLRDFQGRVRIERDEKDAWRLTVADAAD